MRFIRFLSFPLLVITLCLTVASQSDFCPAPRPERDCVWLENENKCVNRAPVIFGKPVRIPNLKIQLYSRDQMQVALDAEVTIKYQWQWLEYPYPEKLRGAWSDANVITKCKANESGYIYLAEYNLTPSGWYKGFFSIGMQPRFTELWIKVFHSEKSSQGRSCTGEASINSKDLESCKRLGKCEVAIIFGCSTRTTIEWN